MKMKKLMKLSALALVLVMLVAAFAACSSAPASDPEDAIAALKENGYEVDSITGAEASVMGAASGMSGLTAAIQAEKGDDEEVSIYYFKDADSADAAYAAIEKQVESTKEYLKATNKDIEIILDKSGEMIWWGTEAAIKAAK